jgi:hypothetical protein
MVPNDAIHSDEGTVCIISAAPRITTRPFDSLRGSLLRAIPAGHAAGVGAELFFPAGRRWKSTRIVQILRLIGGSAAATQFDPVGRQPQSSLGVIELFSRRLADRTLLGRGPLYRLPSFEEPTGIVLRPAKPVQ